MPAVMFQIIDCPSRERVLEAHRYANSNTAGAQLKLIRLMLQKSGLRPLGMISEVVGVAYRGTTSDDLIVNIRRDLNEFEYHGHIYVTIGAIAHLNTTSRKGTITLEAR